MKTMPGFKQLPDGRWQWRIYANGTKQGPRVQTTLPRGTPREEAVAAYRLAVARAAARRGRPIPRRLTFHDAAEEYLKVQRTRLAPGSLVNVERTVKRLEETFGTRALSTLRPSDVTTYQQERLAEGLKPISVNNEVMWFLAIVRKMVAFGWLDRDPVPRGAVESLPVPVPKTDYFRPEEWERFVVALEERRPEAVPVFRALLLTAARVGELVDLRWSGVDLAGKRVTFEMQKKRGEPKSLPVTPELAEILEALPRGVGRALVFTRPDGGAWTTSALRGIFYDARDAARLRQALHVHTIRHTGASWQAQAGVPLVKIKESLGHADIRQTLRYSHLSTEHLTEAVEAIAAVEKSGRRQRGATE
ncbi:site-specific integrase [Acidobacteria bacterium ACD]|nr:MAG: site-specific integrase [Acidobacteriota bacterium]MCE7957630.1 site-specific integrase [Acidobacteria bacterium ACB2]MDL1948333.1 site-specific integrase [Acidobacteria bacterium ACD]